MSEVQKRKADKRYCFRCLLSLEKPLPLVPRGLCCYKCLIVYVLTSQPVVGGVNVTEALKAVHDGREAGWGGRWKRHQKQSGLVTAKACNQNLPSWPGAGPVPPEGSQAPGRSQHTGSVPAWRDRAHQHKQAEAGDRDGVRRPHPSTSLCTENTHCGGRRQLFPFSIFLKTFCHFRKKPCGASAVLCVGASSGPSPTLRHKTKMVPSLGPTGGTLGSAILLGDCALPPAPTGLESLLHSNGTEHGTERTAPFFKYIYVYVYRKNRTQNLALPQRLPPPPQPFSKNNQEKKVYKNILQEFFKVYSSFCRRCIRRPAPPPPPPPRRSDGSILRAPRPQTPPCPRHTDRRQEDAAAAPSLNREAKKLIS